LVIDVNAPAAPDLRPAQRADEPPPPSLGRRVFAAIRVIVTVAILAGLVWKLSPGELRSTISDADPLLLLAALALMCIVQALVAVKWIVLLGARDVHAPIARIVRAYCVGNLLSNVLPTAVGGDVYRVYRIQREADARAADVTMSVLYERATGYGAMTCLGALGAAFYYDHVAIGALALAGGGAAALMLAFVIPRMPFPAVRHDHFLRNLLAHRRELMAVYQMAVLSLAIQALYISTIALAGRALGVEVSWWYWAFATWLVALALLLPITLGGLGVRESGYSGLIDRAGGTLAQGASTGFALGALLIAANAIGLAGVEAYERLRRAQPAQEAAGADAGQ
jgi:uncharacterized membrane protein YbhN (UPF0104 family)